MTTNCFLICVFLCGTFLTTKAQPLGSYADSLWRAKDYRNAALAFEYQYFTANTDAQRNEALLQKTWCYKALKQFDKAQKTAERIALPSLRNDTAQAAVYYELALCAYLAEHYNESLHFVLQGRHFIKDSSLTANLLPLEILSLNELRRWDEGKAKFEQYAQQNGIGASQRDSLYRFVRNPRLRNPDKAHLLSMIFPGAGQWYAGYPSKGITSLAIQTLSLGFGVYSFWHKYYFSGFFTGAGLFNMFYQGGGRYAYYLAQEKNKQLTRRYNDPIKQTIIRTEQQKAQ